MSTLSFRDSFKCDLPITKDAFKSFSFNKNHPPRHKSPRNTLLCMFNTLCAVLGPLYHSVTFRSSGDFKTAPWGGHHPLPLSRGNMNPLSLTLGQVLGLFLLAVAVCQPVVAMCQVRQEEMICWVV